MEGTIYRKTQLELLRKQLAELRKQTAELKQVVTNTAP